MRLSVVLSFVLALILAGLAVLAARNWLAAERQQIVSSVPEVTQSESGKPKNTVVVAAEQIGFGERLIPNKVREIEWAGDIVPQGGFTKIEELIIDDSEENARFALTTIQVGEPVLSSKVTVPGQRAKMSTALTPGMKAISIRVNDVLGVAGFVLPGDRVDVLLTRGSGGSAFVDVLLQGVKVLAIDQIADDRKDQPSVVRTVTFEVNTEEAQKLVLAGNVGTLSLALRNVASSDIEQIDRVTLGDLSEADVAEDLIRANLKKLQEAAERAKAETEQARSVLLNVQEMSEQARQDLLDEQQRTEQEKIQIEQDRLALLQMQAELEQAREEAKREREELLKMQEEAAKAMEEARLASEKSLDEASQQRLDELEALLKSLSVGISERLEGVEQKIQPQEPVIVEKPVVVEVPVVTMPREKSTIGVIRNGKRAEYKVEHVEDTLLPYGASDGQAENAVTGSE